MKKFHVAIAIIFIFISSYGFSQDLSYSYNSKPVAPLSNDYSPVLNFSISGNYKRGITDNTLHAANLIRDLVPGYPVNWISKYLSVEVSGMRNGKIVKAEGVNETLNEMQKNILKSIDLGSNIRITILHNFAFSPEAKSSVRTIDIELTVVPENEAEFPGGREQLRYYLRKNIVDRIQNEFGLAEVVFTISETGEVVNAKIMKSTGNKEADQILLDGINKMKNWIPAKNSAGKNVRQEFVFSVGQSGC